MVSASIILLYYHIENMRCYFPLCTPFLPDVYGKTVPRNFYYIDLGKYPMPFDGCRHYKKGQAAEIPIFDDLVE